MISPFSDVSQTRDSALMRLRRVANEPQTPIRVSFVIDNLSRAGTETQLLALIRHLDRSAIEPTLVLLDGENDLSRSLEPNCPVIRLGVGKLVGLRAAKAALRLRRFWRQYRPDIAQIYFLDSAYFGVPIARLCGVKKVVRVRNNLGYWLTRRHRILNRLLRPWVDVTLTNSEAGREQLLAEGLSPERIAVVENGVDLASGGREADGNRDSSDDSWLPAASRPPFASLSVGCVANLRPVKNIAGFLRAAKIVCDRHPAARFVVAGDGDQRAELHALKESLGLGDRFNFLGPVSEVPAFLRGVSIAVLPSLSEGMSNAVLEYMAAGKAVVATDVGANRVVLGDTGMIVPPGDDAALADAILTLLNDPAETARFGTAARARAEERYSRAAMCRRFEAFYRGLVHGGKNPASPSNTERRDRIESTNARYAVASHG
jgi:glycosyltransferase involved in cell wall biosynthesis